MKKNNFSLFNYLRYRCDKTLLVSESSYRKYYNDKFFMLDDYPQLRVYDDIYSPLTLIKMVILLQALVNKNSIEKQVELYQDANLKNKDVINVIHSRMPYLIYNEQKIYVPLFSPSFNNVYSDKLNLLLKQPYLSLKKDFISSLVNPFFTYGFEIFNSTFTNLILLKTSASKDSAAFYSIEFEMIFIITNQGTLQEQINLFDKDPNQSNKEHLFERLVKLVDFYFNEDKDGFINYLYEGEFISKKTYDFILLKESK